METLERYLLAHIWDSSEFSQLEQFIRRKVQLLLDDRQDFIETSDQLSHLLRELKCRIEQETPCLPLYLPEVFCTLAPQEIDIMLQEFLDRLMRLSRLLHLIAPLHDERACQICTFLASHIDEEMNMDILSRELCLSKKYVSVLIHRRLGMTYGRYLRKMKVERAKKLLSDTDCKVYEIAEQLHFRDNEYFSKIFKQETGTAPSTYRWHATDDLFSRVETAASSSGDITIGVIGCFSGEYSYMDGRKKWIYTYAADEVNAAGGLHGRNVRLIYGDYASDVSRVAETTENLLAQNPDVLVGGYLSSAREIIRPIIDQQHKLFLYDALYEGGVADHYTFVFSTMPEQNFLPAIDAFFAEGKKKVYILATDYNYGILSGEYAKAYIENHGGTISAIEYVPNQKSSFAITIENILEVRPDVLLTFLVGERQCEFFKQWAQAGRQDIPVLTTSAISQGCMHRTTESGVMQNVYFCAPYTEELRTPAADAWRQNIRAKYGEDNIAYLGSDEEAAYLAMRYYFEAVRRCGSPDTESVISALESMDHVIETPGGSASLNPRDHHLIRDVSIFRINEKNEVECVGEVPNVRSEFIEAIFQNRYHVPGGLKELGRKSPNHQFNMMLYKI